MSRAPPKWKDRTYHELETLTEFIMLGGVYDELNMPSLMGFEEVSQRLQLIVEARVEVSQAPSWKWCDTTMERRRSLTRRAQPCGRTGHGEQRKKLKSESQLQGTGVSSMEVDGSNPVVEVGNGFSGHGGRGDARGSRGRGAGPPRQYD